MNVLIIGAKGMLGSMLLQVFADLNPTLWDREDIDITNYTEVEEKVSALAPDVVINAAAYTNVDGAETDSAAAHAVNEIGVRNLAQVAKKINARLVHYSTDYIFPGDQESGYSEDATPGPAVNTYGESKLAGEKVLIEINPRYYILRTAWLYGPNGKNFVDTITRLAQEKPKLTVVNDQFGSPTYTKDVAETTRSILEKEVAPGIYHVVNSGRATWFEFAQEIVRLQGLTCQVDPVSSAEYPLPAKRPKYSMLQDTKGLHMRPWQEALADYLSSKKPL